MVVATGVKGGLLVMQRQDNDRAKGMIMKAKHHRFDRTGKVHSVATFGDAQLVSHIDGQYELRGGSAADHTDATEWISLFLHEAVVSAPPPVVRHRPLSELTQSVSRAAVAWAQCLRSSHGFRPGPPARCETAGPLGSARLAGSGYRAGNPH